MIKTMPARFYALAQRPDLVVRYATEAEDIWPPEMEFVCHDPVCQEYWPRLAEAFPGFQFLGYDEDQERFLAVGNTVPLWWSGEDAGLPPT